MTCRSTRGEGNLLQVSETTVDAFVLDSGAKPRIAATVPTTELDTRVHSWSTIIATLVTALEDDGPPSRSQMLKPGEQVFHRKAGSARKFDTFDKEVDSPCSHGVARFVPWTTSPKAAKGMARRYDNFDVSMLRHWSKLPNCSVYAVFAPNWQTNRRTAVRTHLLV